MYNQILFEYLAVSILLLVFGLIGGAILWFRKKFYLNGNKTKVKQFINDYILRKLIPIILVSGAILNGYDVFLDFALKDIAETSGKLTSISNSHTRFFDTEIRVDGKQYFLPNQLLGNGVISKNAVLKFKYTKRAKIIVEVEKVN